MKLLDLRPELSIKDEFQWAFLSYDCPECKRKGVQHRIGNNIDIFEWECERPCWGMTGSNFADLSLTGSRACALRSTRVMGGCKGHWDIVNGEIIFHGDSGQ
jgi:hypothetical protein